MHAILEPFLLIRFQHKSSLHNICRVRKYSTTVDKGHAIFLRWIDPSLPLRCPNCAAGAPLPADPPAVSGPVSGLIMLLNIKRIKSCKGAVHVLRSNSTNNCKDSWNQPPSKKRVDGRLVTQKRLDIYKIIKYNPVNWNVGHHDSGARDTFTVPKDSPEAR